MKPLREIILSWGLFVFTLKKAKICQKKDKIGQVLRAV
jgi:hypothetical protein